MCKTKMKIDWQNSTLGEVWSESEWHRSTFLKANDYTCNIPLTSDHEYHYSEKCKIHGLEADSNQWKLLDRLAQTRRHLTNKSKEHIEGILDGETDVEAIREKLPSEYDLYKVGTKWRGQDKWEMRKKDGSTYLVDNWLRNLPLGHLRGAMRDTLGAYKKHVDNPSHFGYPDWKKRHSDPLRFSIIHGVDTLFNYKRMHDNPTNRFIWIKIPNADKFVKEGWITREEKHLKVHLPRDFPEDMVPTEVHFTFELGEWWVSFGYKTKSKKHECPKGVVSVDRGVNVAFDLWDGERNVQFHLPIEIREVEAKIVKTQRALSRKQREAQKQAVAQGKDEKDWVRSKKYQKCRNKLAKLYRQKRRILRSFLHMVTAYIAKNYGIAVLEQLRTKDMTKSATGRGSSAKSGLNRAILRIGWGEFERMLKYKCDLVVKVDPKHTSTTCSKCGCNNPLNRGGKSNPENLDRNLFKCRNGSCDHAEHADDNAAKNIRKRGLDKMKSHGIDPMQLWNLALPVGKAGNVKSGDSSRMQAAQGRAADATQVHQARAQRPQDIREGSFGF